MKNALVIALAVVVGCSGAPPDVAAPAAPERPTAAAITPPRADGPPVAKRGRHVEKLHSVDRVDDYYWLRSIAASSTPSRTSAAAATAASAGTTRGA
ncbi:MAG TPA: hypothetical protein VGM56_30865 [Byssovorax sp.]|jgi:hypothetical protein